MEQQSSNEIEQKTYRPSENGHFSATESFNERSEARKAWDGSWKSERDKIENYLCKMNSSCQFV